MLTPGCGQCVNNYLENNAKVPWDDLRYIIGEIMYGGHVVEDWDRRTVEMYLESYLKAGAYTPPLFSSSWAVTLVRFSAQPEAVSDAKDNLTPKTELSTPPNTP